MNKIFRLSCLFVFVLGLVFVTGCKEDDKKKKDKKGYDFGAFESPELNADSIYSFIEHQLSFGHRVPSFKEHVACKDYLVRKLKSYGAQVEVQEFKASFFNIKNAASFNIIASYNPSASRRIMMAAHWDSRLIAEKDADASMVNKPIMGADDGASGTAVLIELARILQQNPTPSIGVDIVLFDAEDQGSNNAGWCQGSEYWSKNPHDPDYFAEYGILLDMIGAKGAQFGYESYSEGTAAKTLYKTWALAKHLGYGDLFVTTKTGPIMDDHFYVMANRGIPMIDIINRPLKTPSGFGHYHHTHKDDISVIDKENLRKVGHVVGQVIFREEVGKF